MAATKAVHECLFCPQTFDSAARKDDHVLEHFPQETCIECDQHLIRIGNNLYTLHNATTCIKIKLKLEPEIECEDVHSVQHNDIQQNITIQNHDLTLKIPRLKKKLKIAKTNVQCISHDVLPEEDFSNSKDSPIHNTNHGDEFDIALEPAVKLEQIEEDEFDYEENSDSESDSNAEQLKKNEDPRDEGDRAVQLKKIKYKRVGCKCNICGNLYFSMGSLRLHKRNIHRNPSETIKKICKICAKPFQTHEELTIHKSTCFAITNTRDEQSQVPVDCNICEKTFSSKRSHRKHMRFIHSPNRDQLRPKNLCDLCGKIYCDTFSLRKHKLRKHADPGTFICKLCLKHFTCAEELKSHQQECRAKLSQNTFECYICRKMTKSRVTLERHMGRVHNIGKPEEKVGCHLCGKFIGASNMQRHQTVMHIKVQHFECNVCGQFLTTKSSLKNHMYRHTGEKPIECLHQGCPKRFRSTAGRIEHMRVHTGEKPFHCTIDGCDKRFAFATDFRRHKSKIHNACSKGIDASK